MLSRSAADCTRPRCLFVFLGTDDALDLFTRNLQLSGRLIAPCDFRRLDIESERDRGLLAGYATLLDRALVERGVLREPSGLNDPWILGCLFAVSDGVIGRVSRLVAVALEFALARNAERLEVEDLALAVDRWAIPNAFCRTNPFLREQAA